MSMHFGIKTVLVLAGMDPFKIEAIMQAVDEQEVISIVQTATKHGKELYPFLLWLNNTQVAILANQKVIMEALNVGDCYSDGRPAGNIGAIASGSGG